VSQLAEIEMNVVLCFLAWHLHVAQVGVSAADFRAYIYGLFIIQYTEWVPCCCHTSHKTRGLFKMQVSYESAASSVRNYINSD